jgi:hypothetical protein
VVVTVLWSFPACLGVRHPQSGSRRSARSAARMNRLESGEDGAILIQPGADGAACGVKLSGSVFRYAEDGEAVRGFGCGDYATVGWES